MSAEPPVPDLTTHLGFWLRVVSNQVSHAFAAKLATQGVTVAEWVMLRTLFHGTPKPPSLVASEMAMTRGAITKLADRLIAKALVAREANQDDRRAQTLRLTPQGRALVPDLAALADQNEAEFFGHLTAAERAALETILKRMVEQSRIPPMALD
jgi:DNA-binding MarR family transcriptional regulator